MSLPSSIDLKERVRQAVDIVDLVGGYLQLRREGRGFKALCPWHDDTRPSLQINPERQSFKCWVCDIGGDIFSFVMKMEGVTFPEALTMLADRAGIQPDPPRGDFRGEGEATSAGAGNIDKRLLYRAMAWAAERYHDFLQNDAEAAAARDYLHERGITSANVQKFQLGYSPDRWEWIVEQARAASLPAVAMEQIGLVARRQQGGGTYDRFRGRVLFPIFDAQARAVGIGGRVLPGKSAADAPKYVNSPETPLFAKSRLLYGLNAAREAIRRTSTVLVMEGYTDCIVAHQSGFENAVAVLGTALGLEHLKLLRRYVDDPKVVLVLDGDEAGRRRAKEVLQLFISAAADVRVLTLPDELDPCEFLRQRGAESFAQAVAAAPDALRHVMAVETAGSDPRDVHARSRAFRNVVSAIASAPQQSHAEHRARVDMILRDAARQFGFDEQEVRNLVGRTRAQQQERAGRAGPLTKAALGKSQRTDPATETDDATAKPDPFEIELLEIVLLSPDAIGHVSEAILAEISSHSLARRVFTKCRELHAGGVVPEFARLLLEFDDAGVKNLLVACDEQGRRKGSSDLENRLRDVLAAFDTRRQERLRKEDTAALRRPQLADADELALLRQIEQRERTRQGISELTDG